MLRWERQITYIGVIGQAAAGVTCSALAYSGVVIISADPNGIKALVFIGSVFFLESRNPLTQSKRL